MLRLRPAVISVPESALQMASTPLLYVLVIILSAVYLLRRRFNPLYAIPAVGPSLPLLSYIGALRFTRHAHEMLQEGYVKYKGSAFRLAQLDRWVVVLCGPKMNEELQRMPDDQVSFLDAAEDLVQTKYTIAKNVIENPIHISVMRGPLTRNLAPLLLDVIDEINIGVEEHIPTRGDEWVSVPGLATMTQIVSRASNRVFVGLPMCRDPEYFKIISNFPRDVAKGRFILSITPTFLKSIVGPLLPWSRRTVRQYSALVKPIIEERQRLLLEHRDPHDPDRPNDFMTWLIEEGRAVDQPIDLLVNALLSSNFVAIHTSSISVTHALYNLAAYPEYQQPIRDEIVEVLKAEGWTKQAFGKMWKLDSFMRESQRMFGISAISVIRKALKDVTLSDGTVIPTGTLIAVAAEGTHYDEGSYDNPYIFNPFRFSDMRGDEGERIKHQYVSTSSEYVSFGHGKHACPGRFFASNELKAILSRLILDFDMKFGGDGQRPPNQWFGSSIIPSQTANVMFRKRPDSGL